MKMSPLIRKFLLVISKGYTVAVSIRNRLFDKGWLKIHRLRNPVISIGNLTLGGTGKTPAVIEIGKILQRSGYTVSVLLRGYKGNYGGNPLLVPDGKDLKTTSLVAGDEALVIAKNLPGALVTVSKDRVKAGKWVEQWSSANIHLLDDGFQHRKLYRSLNLLLIDVTNPFGSEYLFPAGFLREPLKELRRADAVILTRTQNNVNYQPLIDQLHFLKSDIPCFLATQSLQSASEQSSQGTLLSFPLTGLRALAFAGIANPNQFFELLRKYQVDITKTICFRDHHRYTPRDLAKIQKQCQELKINTVITTEKDAENLPANALNGLRVVTVKVNFQFNGSGLSQMLSRTMKANLK